ncbi:hypothetical protein V8E55_003938 [Tylopilus felleus]
MKSINSTPLHSERTSIFIAHRLRTVVEAGKSVPVDKFYVLKDDQIIEEGTHEELLRLGRLYHGM